MIPEDKIQEFVKRIREAAGDNLECVVLYGSAANGTYDAEFSNLNFLCLLRETSFAKLNQLAAFAKWWRGLKQPLPHLMTRAELEATTDVFTIELIDMQQHRRILYGDDVIAALEIPRNMHRAQVEYELREKLVLLRERALIADGKEQHLWELLVHSAPSFATLFRHALIALGHPASIDRRQAVNELAKFVSFDSSAILQVLDVRERKLDAKKVDVRELFARYLDGIEKVTSAVDKAFEPGE
ncbi:MAG TPA: nucleotidyltransferase domain-containing protein [Terriglobales bacterium]